MQTKQNSIVILAIVAALTALAAESEQKTLKAFTVADPTISKEFIVTNDAWLAKPAKAQVFRLFEVSEPSVDKCIVTFRAKLKTEDLDGPAYLEMWCRFPGKGDYFSRGVENPVTGSSDWASYETTFLLRKGVKPDRVKLNLVVKGGGKVWIKDVELLTGPLPARK